MLEYIEVLTYWKKELSSQCNEEVTIALAEIIELIKRTNSERIFETCCEIYLNRDLCHFLCELLSIDRLYKTQYINTIACYLSESSKFYNNDFFRIMKIYLRLLTSMNESNDINSSDYKYIDGIFKSMALIMMRALELQINFNDDRFSIQQLLAAMSKLNEELYEFPSMIHIFNAMMEVILFMDLTYSEEDHLGCLENFIIITRYWKLTERNMRNVNYYCIATETAYNLMDYVVTYGDHLEKGKHLISLVVEKILILSKFALDGIANSNEHLEIFCNFWYHLLFLLEPVPNCKVQTLNLFFKFRGQDVLTLATINTFDVDEMFVKELQLVLAEVMTHVTAMFQNLSDCTKINNLRKKLVGIFLKQDTVKNLDAELTRIFDIYMDIKMKFINNRHNNLLVAISDIIVKLNELKVGIDSSFLVMLLATFTELFDPGLISSENSISKASSILKKNYCLVTPEINNQFIRWWLYKNSPKQEEYEQVILTYISRDIFELTSTSEFDLKWLAKLYFDENTEKRTRINILNIFVHSRLKMNEIKKLLTRLQKCLQKDATYEICGILDVLGANAYHFNPSACCIVTQFVHLILNQRKRSIEMRYGSVDLGHNLLKQIRNLIQKA